VIQPPHELIPFQDIPHWDDFVNSHPAGNVLHTASMIRCFQATKKHNVFAYGAVNQEQKLVAALVATQVTTLGGMVTSLASRSVLHAEPIYLDDPDGHQGVRSLIQLHDSQMRNKVLFAEVRPIAPYFGDQDPLLDCGYERIGYRNYELNITLPENELFKNLDGKCRNNVRSAQRKGVTVQPCDALSDLPECYDLFKESYAQAKVPIVDQSLFRAAAEQLCHKRYRMMQAFYEGQPVAAGCFLAYKNRVICWYLGTKRIPGVAAAAALFWEAIRIYAEEGYEIFDFAGAGWEGEEYGPGRFKAKFGGEIIHIGRYRKIYSPWKLKAAQSVYETIRGWIAPREASQPHPTSNES
jgi:serine/alanine adding enzyme